MMNGLAKYVGGKVLAAVLTVAAILVVIWYWRLAPQDRAAMWGMVRGALLWSGLVAALPWALFFVPDRVVRAESNTASAVMLVAYLVVDLALALYLMGGFPTNGWHRAIVVLGLLCAAVYNLIVCEFLAQRTEDST